MLSRLFQKKDIFVINYWLAWKVLGFLKTESTHETANLLFYVLMFLSPRHEMAEGHIGFRGYPLGMCACACVFQNRVRAIT